MEYLERSLVHKISYYGIELTPPERAMLPGADVGAAPGRTIHTPRFAAADPDDSPAETDLLNCAVGRPDLRRIVKTRRLQEPEAVLYVVVCAAGTDVSRLQGALEVDALVEVVAEDEQLPPYQASALAAGRQLWPTRYLR
ncbi:MULTISPECIES: hypothetical protein [unclassified Nocardia]|uniref:hypothetical protein n=1 Tax=unclassified Nocardia TaxID=2637762 RepID=UPI0024A8F21B|nr:MULTISPECIES: hypothetical protein [unclassified Nocardia]